MPPGFAAASAICDVQPVNQPALSSLCYNAFQIVVAVDVVLGSILDVAVREKISGYELLVQLPQC